LRAKTCKECITSAADCFWCAQINFGNNRCFEKHLMPEINCPQHEIYVAKNEFNASNDEKFSETIGPTIQLKPQKYEISLKPNSQVVIPIYFQRVQDYPMDLYYLMDLSGTMKNHKEKLAKVAQKIAATIEKTTNNFRIGFGSFVDKPLIPYSYYDNEFSISCLY
jgi:hypothetical protein